MSNSQLIKRLPIILLYTKEFGQWQEVEGSEKKRWVPRTEAEIDDEEGEWAERCRNLMRNIEINHHYIARDVVYEVRLDINSMPLVTLPSHTVYEETFVHPNANHLEFAFPDIPKTLYSKAWIKKGKEWMRCKILITKKFCRWAMWSQYDFIQYWIKVITPFGELEKALTPQLFLESQIVSLDIEKEEIVYA